MHYKLQDFSRISERDVFFDANILIYLFWPTGQFRYEENYARTFRNLLRQGNKLYVDFLVISEVINRIIRVEYNKSGLDMNFKEYRNSEEGQDVLNDIYTIIKEQIINRFNFAGKAFSKDDINSFLSIDELDFVDKAIVSICTENDFILLTNDRDFKNSSLDILTGNPRILY